MIRFIIDEEGLKNDPKVPQWIKDNPQVLMPERKRRTSAGYDIKMPVDFVMKNTGTRCHVVDSYIKIEMSPEYVAEMYVRSSVGVKKYTQLMNSVGIIDSDYKDTIKIPLYFFGPRALELKAGDGIVQILFKKYEITDDDVLVNMEKPIRTGGIGSTDKPQNK